MAWQVNGKTWALVIHPEGIEDMGNLLAVARAEGQKLLRCKVRVHPLAKEMNGCFVVLVEPCEVGRTNNQMQGKADVVT